MRSSHHCRFAWLMIFFLLANNCFAAAVPKYNGRMNNAVKKVIGHKLHKKFSSAANDSFFSSAANDPHFNATVSAIGSGVTTLVGGVIIGTTWPALLLATGVSAIVGYAVPLAIDKGVEWIFKDNGEIENTIEQNIPSGVVKIKDIPEENVYDLPINVVSYVRHTTKQFPKGLFHKLEDLDNTPDANHLVHRYILKPYDGNFLAVGSYDGHIFVGKNRDANVTGYGWKSVGVNRKGDAGILEDPNFLIDEDNPTPDSTVNISSISSSGSIAGVIDSLSEQILDKKLSPGMLAIAVNAVWRAAGGAAGGTSWSADDPVTEKDVQDWLDAYPDEAPTVGDFIAPVAPPAVATFSLTANNPHPMPSTSTAAASETAVNPETGQAQHPEPNPDPPPDPDIDEPNLEDIPTAEMILAPLLNLMSDLKNFSVPSHMTVCPVSSFTALGKEYQFRAHCDLIEQNRVLIESAMLLAWAITALFIVLKA